jgi:glutamate-1-semialdehyde 2,1-aminomutase
VHRTADAGLTFGAPSSLEIELAERIKAAYPDAEMMRFVSSGTEAVMSAVRLARGFTGRDIVVKFSGCYHGHSDAMLVAGGSGLATFGTSSSAGVTTGAAADTAVVPLDDETVLQDLFEERGCEIAAVIIEPLPANAGLLRQRPEFLRKARELTEEYDALLILDEVISGFRVGMGGAAALYDLPADLVTFGKIIGGGMPVGAFGGRRDIMERVAPLGDVYQAGTLSGNPVAMAAGAATLQVLAGEDVHSRLEKLGRRLEEGVAAAVREAGGSFVRVGSIFWLVFQPQAPRSFEAIDASGMQRFADLHAALLERGVYLAPSGYEVGFLNHAMTESDIDSLATVLRESLTALPA